MARVKIQDIVNHLSSDIKHALETAVEEVSDAEIDRSDLFRAFYRAVGRKCSTWAEVPDNLVEKE